MRKVWMDGRTWPKIAEARTRSSSKSQLDLDRRMGDCNFDPINRRGGLEICKWVERPLDQQVYILKICPPKKMGKDKETESRKIL